MKLRILFLTFVTISLFAMEDPRLGKRAAQEPVEQLQGDLKAQKVEPIQEIKYPLASLAGLPSDIQNIILGYLVTSQGVTDDERLLFAAVNIRNFLIKNKRFKVWLDDKKLAGEIINELAQRYSNNDVVKAAIALSTNAASKWLAAYVKEQLGIGLDGSITSPLSDNMKLLQNNLQVALEYAVNNNRVDILRFLLTYQPWLANWRVTLNIGQEVDDVPLLEGAIVLENPAMIRLVLNSGGKIADSIVMSAASKSCPVALNELVQAGADLHKMYEGDPLLFLVSSEEMIVYLLSKGLDINKKNDMGITALHQAIIDAHFTIANMLLQKGANPDIQDNLGNTPLHVAIIKKTVPAFLNNLLNKTTNFEIPNKQGNTPLALAILAGNPVLIQLLLEHGARMPQRVHEEQANGNIIADSPLVYLLRTPLYGDFKVLLQVLTLLVEHGADVNALVIDQNTGTSIRLLTYLKNQPRTPIMNLIINFLAVYGAHE